MATKKTNTGFDLSSVPAIAETAEVDLVHPKTGDVLRNGDGDPMTITVYGADSPHYRAIQNAQQDKRLQKAARKQTQNITSAQIQADADELLIKIVHSWTIVLNGETPAVDEKTVRQIFSEYPWIKEQIDTGAHDRRNFMKG